MVEKLELISLELFQSLGGWALRGILVPAIPQSEVLAKFFEEIGEKCGEIFGRNCSQIFTMPQKESGKRSLAKK